MAAIEVILLQRVPKLGQMGDRVRVKPGYARNFLLPQKKALRATKENSARFAEERVHLEAQNLKRREEAEAVAGRVQGLTVTLIRQAGDSGSLYGSVTSRDIADGATEGGLQIDRSQVELDHPIKTLGVRQVRVVLHPEVVIKIAVNVARSVEEAEKQIRGEAVGRAAEEENDTAADIFGTDDEDEAASAV
jgi:large subunit ribosomal protein L9